MVCTLFVSGAGSWPEPATGPRRFLEGDPKIRHKDTVAVENRWRGERIRAARRGSRDAPETGRIDAGRRIGEMGRVGRRDGVQPELHRSLFLHREPLEQVHVALDRLERGDQFGKICLDVPA